MQDSLGQFNHEGERAACNTGLAKVAVQCSASTFVVKIAAFGNTEIVNGNLNKRNTKILFLETKY